MPALALPTVASAATEPDPAFAAIDTHRQALVQSMTAARHNFFLGSRDKGKEEADAAADVARTAEDDAQWELANVVPNTVAGVLALFAYLHDLYVGAIALPEDPANWRSNEESDGLSSFADEEIIDRFSGEPMELPLIFWITRNVREALQEMAVQS